MRGVRLILGADHQGFNLKEELKDYFDSKHIKYEDVGTFSRERVDYPKYAIKVAKIVSKDKNSKGILICGTGTGMVIAANKVSGARAVLAYDNYSAKMSRKDNDANIISLRSKFFSHQKAKKIVLTWLKTKFSNKKRHKRRIGEIKSYEKNGK